MILRRLFANQNYIRRRTISLRLIAPTAGIQLVMDESVQVGESNRGVSILVAKVRTGIAVI